MAQFTITTTSKSGKVRERGTVEAPSAPKALRAYGCNVKGRKHSYVTKRGATVKASPVSA